MRIAYATLNRTCSAAVSLARSIGCVFMLCNEIIVCILINALDQGHCLQVDVAIKVLTSPTKFKEANLEKWAQVRLVARENELIA